MLQDTSGWAWPAQNVPEGHAWQVTELAQMVPAGQAWQAVDASASWSMNPAWHSAFAASLPAQ